MNAISNEEVFALSENRLVAVLTSLAILGVVASLSFGGLAGGLLHVTYYITSSGAAAGGAAGGTGAVVAAGISASELGGAYLAGAVVGGAVGVVAAAA
jgi:hypothetical protein